MQEEMLTLRASESEIERLGSLLPELKWIYQRYRDEIGTTPLKDLVITRRIGRERYQNKCIPQAVIDVYRMYGVELVPGMDASFIVRDEKGLKVDPAFDPKDADVQYYRRLLDKAWEEVKFPFSRIQEF